MTPNSSHLGDSTIDDILIFESIPQEKIQAMNKEEVDMYFVEKTL
jgi:hypothetical protein